MLAFLGITILEAGVECMNRVSVFMPCYNSLHFVEETIKSVLNQTYKNFDFIIVDDGSTDGTLNILKKYEQYDERIKVFSNGDNKGLPYTRNRMFDLCNNEYVAIIDSDDIMPLYRLEVGVDFLDANPDISAVGGAMQIIDENGEFCQKVEFPANYHGAIMARLIVGSAFVNGSMMMRKSVMIEGKMRYDARFPAMQDYKFWSDFAFAGKMMNLNQIMLYYRIRKNSVTDLSERKMEERTRLFDIVHEEYVTKLCGPILTEKEMEVFIKGTRRASLDISESNVIKRLIFATKFQLVMSKIVDNCKYRDDDFNKEISEMIDVYSSKLVRRGLSKMRLICF